MVRPMVAKAKEHTYRMEEWNLAVLIGQAIDVLQGSRSKPPKRSANLGLFSRMCTQQSAHWPRLKGQGGQIKRTMLAVNKE